MLLELESELFDEAFEFATACVNLSLAGPLEIIARAISISLAIV